MAHVTIPDQDSYVIYTAQTGTGPYVVPFAIFEKADLTVLVGGVEIAQGAFAFTDTSSPAVTGGYQTGTITLSVAAAAQDVMIYRRINPKRTSDFGPGPENRDAKNSAFDRIHAQLQDNRRDLDRTVLTPLGETPPSPGADGTLLGWAGGILANIAGSIATAAVSSFMSAPILATSAHAFAKLVGLPMVVGTQAQLKALTSPSTSISYRTLCRATAGDRGGGTFYWLASSQATNVTNDASAGVYVPPNSDASGASGAWVRTLDESEKHLAPWFGIIADGSTNNTTAFNNATAFLGAQGGGTLALMRGTTLASGQLSILASGVCVVGAADGVSYLRSTYTAGPQCLIGPLTGSRANEIYFKGVTFWGKLGVHFFHQRYSRGLYFTGCKGIELGGLLKMGDAGATSGAYIAEIRDCELSAASPEIVVAADTGFTLNEVLTFGSGGTATLIAKNGTTFTLKFLTAVPAVSTSVTGGTSGKVTTVASRVPSVDFVSVEYAIGEFNVYQSRVEGGYDWTVAGLNFSNNAWESTPGVAGLFDTCGFHDNYWARFGYNIKISDRRLGNVNWTNNRFHEAGIAAVLWEIPTGSTRALDRTGGGSGVIANTDVSSNYAIAGVYAKGFVFKNDSTVNSYIGDLVIAGIHGSTMQNSLLELNSQRTLGLRAMTVIGVNGAQMQNAAADVVIINAGSTTAFSGILIDDIVAQGTFSDAIASTGGSVPDGGLRIGPAVHAFGTFSSRINGTLARVGENFGSAVYDPINLVDGAGATTTVTVTGAALGEVAWASFSLDLQGITVTAWVSSANTVSVRLQNETGGALDLASGTLRAFAKSN